MQFGCLGDSVVIRVLPQPQTRKDRVVPGYETIAIAAILRVVKNCECQEPIFLRAGRLRSKIAEQLSSGVDRVVAVTVEGQPCIIAVRRRPGQPIRRSVAVDVEIHSIRCVR